MSNIFGHAVCVMLQSVVPCILIGLESPQHRPDGWSCGSVGMFGGVQPSALLTPPLSVPPFPMPLLWERGSCSVSAF